MKNKRLLLIFTGFLILFYIIISIIYIIPKNKKYKNTIFIGNYTKILVSDKDIYINNDNNEIEKQKVKIYFKKDYIDGYIYTEEQNLNSLKNALVAYNNNDAQLIFNEALIAYTDDISIEIKDSNKTLNKNLDEVKKFFSSKNISISQNTQLDYLYINTFDDDEETYIYSVGLIDNSKYYSYVFIKNNNKYTLICSKESDYNGVNYIRLSYFKSIKINDSEDYFYVIKNLMSEYGPEYYDLYSYDGNNFINIGGE